LSLLYLRKVCSFYISRRSACQRGVVNNAGIAQAGPADWVSLERFKDVADVTLWGLIDVTKTFLPLVKKAKGRIVNVTSIGGIERI
jgi:NAD(P)-dependent dehydrogenase (short-subunit alcohol dehydrogenase family)